MRSPEELANDLNYLAQQTNIRFGKHPDADLVREAEAYIRSTIAKPETTEPKGKKQ